MRVLSLSYPAGEEISSKSASVIAPLQVVKHLTRYSTQGDNPHASSSRKTRQGCSVHGASTKTCLTRLSVRSAERSSSISVRSVRPTTSRRPSSAASAARRSRRDKRANGEKGKRRKGEKGKASLDCGLRTPDAGLLRIWPSASWPSRRRWQRAELQTGSAK